jgi:hypothetical protein
VAGSSVDPCAAKLARCRERLALTMTRLSQAHWELDRLVEEHFAYRPVGAEVVSAEAVLRWAVADYSRAFAELIASLPAKPDAD